jgi:hypothetical protein
MWKKLQVPLRTFLPILNRIKWLLKTSFLTATCMRFLLVHLFRRRSIFDKEKIPLRQGQNYRTFAKIAKILLKKYF